MQIKYKISSPLLFLILVPLILSFTACELPTEIDLREIEDVTGYFKLILENEEFFKSEELILNDSQFGKLAHGPLYIENLHSYPHSFQRVVKSREISTEFLSDTVAIVTLNRIISGELIITIDESSGEQQTISKPFTEEAIRKAKFHRVGNTGIPEYDWKLVELSLLSGGHSDDPFSIISLEVKFDESLHSHVDKNPLEKFFKIWKGDGAVPTIEMGHFLENGVAITVTIKSSYESEEQVFLRHGGVFLGTTRGYMLRSKLEPPIEEYIDSDGLYKRVYSIDWRPLILPDPEFRRGRFSAIVEVISFETLNEEHSKVESKYWGVPFVVE